MKKTSEIRNLSDDELQTQVRDGQAEIFNLRLRRRTGQLEKPSRIRELRRANARALTILRERRSGAGAPAASTASAAPKAKTAAKKKS